MKKIVIDVCGGDLGAEVIVRGVKAALPEMGEHRLILVGDERIIRNTLGDALISEYQIEILHTEDYITNHDAPTAAFKGREGSSMVMALDRLKNDADCVGMLCAGNTGALMVGSIFRLGLARGLRQPALASALPTFNGKHMALVDCGASTDCKPEDLTGFALMGDAFVRAMYGVEEPKIALLSVGREDTKGNSLTKEAFALLKRQDICFIGNIEGSDVLTGEADVVVCDGFTGNVVLKNAEAVASYAMSLLDAPNASAETQECLSQIKKRLHSTFAYNALGGAVFLGTRKAIIKMHGCASESTAASCIQQLIRLEEHHFAESTLRTIEAWKNAQDR